MIADVTRVSYESFRDRTAGKKLVLLAPNSAYRGVLLGYFLRAPGEAPLYYRIPAGETTIPALVRGLADEMDATLQPEDAAAFSGPLRSALNDPSALRLAEALAAGLGALRRSPAVLFIDEFDQLQVNADFHTFVMTLVHHLGPDTQIVINARALRAQPWYDLIAHGDAVVIGSERTMEAGMLSIQSAFKPQIEVFGFGFGHVLVNGQPLTRWDGALPRSLFFFFIDRPLLTRDEIFHAFWSELGSKEATNVFHVTKRKISECISSSIEDGATYELTKYQNGYYLPNERVTRHYDVFEFSDFYQRADGTDDPQKAYDLFRHAIDLHSAPFLTSIEMGWANERRASLQQMLIHSLSSASRLARGFGDRTRALDYALRALALQSTSPELHEVAAGLALENGRRDEALRLFAQLETLYREAGAPLSEEGRALGQRLAG